MADGRMVRSVREFVELHRDWFASSTWKLDAEPVHTIETPDLGIAVLYLNYRDTPEDAHPIHESSLLTLVFARRGQRWVMAQDQTLGSGPAGLDRADWLPVPASATERRTGRPSPAPPTPPTP